MVNITAEHMKEYVEANPKLVKLKPTSKEDVFVLKYNNKVFYNNLWTPELEECRGTVVDADYNIISRPFTKIYNRGERNMDIPRDMMVMAVEKVNGFMACATWHNDELLVSTTGTIDSEFADVAYLYLQSHTSLMKQSPNMSFIFEICTPEDQHIIPEKYGAYLLGARYKTWHSPNHAHAEWLLDELGYLHGIMRPKWSKKRFSDVVEEVKTVDHEGYVCYTIDNKKELKMKSPYYLTTKFLGRVKEEKFEKWLKNPEELKKIIDEEFFGIIDHMVEIGYEDFFKLDEYARMFYVRDYFNNNVL